MSKKHKLNLIFFPWLMGQTPGFLPFVINEATVTSSTHKSLSAGDTDGKEIGLGGFSLSFFFFPYSLLLLPLFQTTGTKWLNISVSIEGLRTTGGDGMKKSFSQSIRLSNWSAVISANDGSPVPARTKGAPPLFCEGKRPRVPLQRKGLLWG